MVEAERAVRKLLTLSELKIIVAVNSKDVNSTGGEKLSDLGYNLKEMSADHGN